MDDNSQKIDSNSPVSMNSSNNGNNNVENCDTQNQLSPMKN